MSMVGDDAWVDFAAGGGKVNFYNATEVDATGEPGARVDGRDLLVEASDAGVMVAQTRDEFMALDFKDRRAKKRENHVKMSKKEVLFVVRRNPTKTCFEVLPKFSPETGNFVTAHEHGEEGCVEARERVRGRQGTQ